MISRVIHFVRETGARLLRPRVPSRAIASVNKLLPRATLISVVMTTYNHEKYIAAAVESVLGQTHNDFELIIVNDGSTDGTEEVIRSYRDRRINYIKQPNQGESVALNRGAQEARGKFIALMDGDDVCLPHRLQCELAFLFANNARAVTSWIELIDEDGLPKHDRTDLIALCNCIPARTRGEILRKLWVGNYLWPSTTMLEKQLFWEAGGCCVSSAQLQDYMLWIELIKRTHIHTMPEPLVKYRVRAGQANVSQNPRYRLRAEFEMRHIYRRMFNGLPQDVFCEAFDDRACNTQPVSELDYEIQRALVYLSHSEAFVREIGAEMLFDLFQSTEAAELLSCVYDFSVADFLELSLDGRFLAPGFVSKQLMVV